MKQEQEQEQLQPPEQEQEQEHLPEQLQLDPREPASWNNNAEMVRFSNTRLYRHQYKHWTTDATDGRSTGSGRCSPD